jgi:hypothetical protein
MYTIWIDEDGKERVMKLLDNGLVQYDMIVKREEVWFCKQRVL